MPWNVIATHVRINRREFHWDNRIKSQKIVAKRKRSPSVAVDNTKKDPKDPWKTFSRLKGSAGIPVDLLIEDYQMIETTSRMVFPVVHKQSVGSNQCGPLVCCFMAEILLGKRETQRTLCSVRMMNSDNGSSPYFRTKRSLFAKRKGKEGVLKTPLRRNNPS